MPYIGRLEGLVRVGKVDELALYGQFIHFINHNQPPLARTFYSQLWLLTFFFWPISIVRKYSARIFLYTG
jgi:hypothetical protein